MVASSKRFFPEQPPPPARPFANDRVASVMPEPAREAPPPRTGPLAYAPRGMDGTAQFMSGRGLY
jgi:hypothetical protein